MSNNTCSVPVFQNCKDFELKSNLCNFVPVNSQGTMSMASMWTRKDVDEFKESIRREGGDAVLKVGHGETVTVKL